MAATDSAPALLKRSVTLHGHRTSLALEPEFWAALDAAAAEEDLALAALVAHIDDGRAARPGRTLASAIRVFLLERAARR